jgi:hypothetical protein
MFVAPTLVRRVVIAPLVLLVDLAIAGPLCA